MSSPAVVAAPAPTPALRSAFRRSLDDRTPGARAVSYGVLLLLWVVSIGGSIAQTLTMTRKQAAEGLQTVYTQAVIDAGHIAFLVPAVIAVLVIVFRVVHVRNDIAPLLLAITPSAWIAFSEFARGNAVTEQVLLPIGVAVTLWAVQTRVGDLRLYALAAAILATVSMALTTSAPALMYMPQSFDEATDKTVTGLPLLAGFFSHPNGAGLFFALALPLTSLFQRWYLRGACAAVLLTAILWTSSRTALFGAGVWLAVMLLRPFVRRTLHRVLLVALVGLTVAVVALPLTTTDAEAFTERGAIWQFLLGRLNGQEWLFGLGHAWFSDNYPMLKSALSSAASHGHNVFVTYAVTGGLVLVALLGLVVAHTARIASRLPIERERVAAMAFLCVLVAVSITETAWRLEAPDTLFAAMAVPLFVIATQSRPMASERRGSPDRPPVTRTHPGGNRQPAGDRPDDSSASRRASAPLR
ncbi:O-antigen ligase family protein [Microbacterium sp.]|uniref:O-antigen ligase family protein n=1 Tax=Microbacterium sp. TaxID=51671 RepID=UPI00391896A8